MKEEIWKPVPGYEDRYLASSSGRIKSLPKTITLWHGSSYTTKERIIAPRPSGGYLFVAIFNGENKSRLDIQLHRLIALTFIPNTGNKSEVNHINGDKLDNRVENLEWVTRRENVIHAYQSGLYAGRERDVQCLCTGRIIKVSQAAKELGVSRTYMWGMLRGDKPNWSQYIYLI